MAGDKLHVLLIRGDHSLNEVKTGKVAGLADFRFATEAEIRAAFNCPPGFLGPVGLDRSQIASSPTAPSPPWPISSAAPTSRNSTPPASTGAATCPNPIWWPTSATSSSATPARTARARSTCAAASRSATFSSSAPSIPKRSAPRFSMSRAGPHRGHGLLRHRRVAHRRRGHRAGNDERGIIWPQSIAPFELVIVPLGYGNERAVRKPPIRSMLN
jgi:prolyl-tRNA synthetase